jgi:hypothetical protein
MPCGRRFLAVVLAGIASLGGGCVSAKYKSVEKPTTPPLLNLVGDAGPVLCRVDSVVIYRGPGSWKRDAYWDEYLVALRNQGDVACTVESVTLTDFTGTSSPPSDNPWALEKASRTREEELKTNTKDVLIQIGGGYVGLTASIMGGTAIAGFTGGVIALPAFVAGTIYSNVHHRHLIENKFAARRVKLPAVIEPGQTLQGSLFFRISPGPRKLTLLVEQAGTYRKVTIDLASLSGLHLKTRPKPPPAEPTSAADPSA